LMRLVGGDAVEGGSGFKADRSTRLAAEVNDLLQARPTGAFRDQDPVERAASEEGFTDGVDADKEGHWGSM
jgi:hypothetical protein